MIFLCVAVDFSDHVCLKWTDFRRSSALSSVVLSSEECLNFYTSVMPFYGINSLYKIVYTVYMQNTVPNAFLMPREKHLQYVFIIPGSSCMYFSRRNLFTLSVPNESLPVSIILNFYHYFMIMSCISFSECHI